MAPCLWLAYQSSLVKDQENGQGLIEYALIIVIMALAVVLTLTAMGEGLEAAFSRFGETLTGLSQ